VKNFTIIFLFYDIGNSAQGDQILNPWSTTHES